MAASARLRFMSFRVVVAFAIAAMMGFGFAAWIISTQMTRPPSASPSDGSPAPSPAASGEMPAPPADPGVTWSVPKRWTIDIAQGMRAATYIVPAAGGEGAECAVYYFGPGQGGGVDANLERWIGEFEPLEGKDVRKMKPGGLEVTRIEARGTYVAHSMRSGESAAQKPAWALTGAIVNGPQGDVFFKLVGPAATVGAAAKEFDGMLGSLRKK